MCSLISLSDVFPYLWSWDKTRAIILDYWDWIFFFFLNFSFCSSKKYIKNYKKLFFVSTIKMKVNKDESWENEFQYSWSKRLKLKTIIVHWFQSISVNGLSIKLIWEKFDEIHSFPNLKIVLFLVYVVTYDFHKPININIYIYIYIYKSGETCFIILHS